MPLRFKIQVGAPPEKVFNCVSDIANHPAIRPETQVV